MFLLVAPVMVAQLPSNVPTSSLIAFWPFSGNANDASGNGINGLSPSSTPVLTNDRFNTPGSAYYFNGINALIDVPFNSAMAGMNDLSISAWINVDTLNGIQHIVSKWNFIPCNVSGGDTYAAALIGSGAHLATNNNPTAFSNPAVLSSSVINTWKHLVFINSASTGQSVYVDGVLAATHSAPGAICASTNSLFIGACEGTGGQPFSRYFKGEIDDVGMWNRVLTPCEIFQLYAQGILPGTTASSNTICAGSSLSLTATGLNSYTWMPGNLTGSVVAVTPTASTVYTVTAANASGCTVTSTLAVSVNPGNTLSISAGASPTLICPGSTSTLSASGAQSYTWQPGGLIGSLAVVAPSVSTVYTVTGEDQSCTTEATVRVNIGREANPTPYSTFCTGSLVTIGVGTVSANDVLQWSGPGISGTVGGSVISVSQPGIYSVVITDTVTGCSGTGTVNVLPGLPLINIVPSATQACFPGPPVNLLVSIPANLSWLPAGEVIPNVGPLVSVSPSVTSSYTVIATSGTCQAQAAITISVNAVPASIVTSGDTSLCYGKTVNLSAQGALDFYWAPANVFGDTVAVTPNHSTTYTVTGFNGICANTSTLRVSVLDSPQLNTYAQPPVICLGQTAVLLATGAPTLAWISADPPPISATAAVNPLVNTQYSVVGTNTLGCSSIATVEVRVINSPAITATASAFSICAGQSVSLTALGVASHTWNPGPIVADSIVVSPTVSTTYTVMADTTICGYVTLRIEVNNCVNKHLGIAYVFATPERVENDQFRVGAHVLVSNNSNSPFNAVVLRTNLAQMIGFPLSYTVLSAPRKSLNSQLSPVSNFNGSSQTELTDSTSALLPGSTDTLYFSFRINPGPFSGRLTGQVTGSARDAAGIIATDSSASGWIIDPDGDGDPTNNNEPSPLDLPLLELSVPDGLSPNGDGINDKFVIKGLRTRSVRLLIFNRWGNKVYEQDNYDNSWDGTANAGVNLGKGRLPEGVYYYILQFNDGSKEVQKGFVMMNY